mmetsp:Transcript_37407/g.89955  ORF Transcript_37407/g.89955 Transcript_37407/m.89955 type:complete len:188 (-) Transcript_37407:875-1438(-)
MSDAAALSKVAPVVIFSKPSCPFCKGAKATFTEAGVPFMAHEVDNDEALYAALKAMTGKQTVPQIFIGGELLGGGDELGALSHDEIRERARAAGAEIADMQAAGPSPEVEKYICELCETKDAAPEGKTSMLKTLGRTLAYATGIGTDKPIVAVDDLYKLAARLITGEKISLEKFRGKVTLVVNTASK